MESIYQGLLAAKERGEDLANWLPEEHKKDKDLSSIPGAWDAVMLYHMGTSHVEEEEVKEFLRGIIKRSLTQEEIEAYVDENSALALLEPLQKALQQLEGERFVGELIYFSSTTLEETTKEEMVKFSLALLRNIGVDAFEEIKETIRLFARTDAFALYAFLVMKSWENSDEEIFEAMKELGGWGRVHGIELLEEPTEEMKQWLFLHGCTQDTLYDYCALGIYQKAGVLHLVQRELSQEEFAALDKLTYHLMVEATREGITALDDEEKTKFLLSYFSHVKKHASCAKDYATALYTWDYYKNHEKIGPVMKELFASSECRVAAKNALENCQDLALAKFLELDYAPSVYACMKGNIKENYPLGSELLQEGKMVEETIQFFEGLLEDEEKKELAYTLLPSLKDYPSQGKKILLSALEQERDKYRYQALSTCIEWTKKEDRVLASFFPESFPVLKKLMDRELSSGEKDMVKELFYGRIYAEK